MRDALSRIAGGVLVLVSMALLILSPGKADFSAIHFLLFLAFFTAGMLLLSGIAGTHPAAARARRKAAMEGTRRAGPQTRVQEQVFPFAGSRVRGRATAVFCALLGLSLAGLGIFIQQIYPSNSAESFSAGLLPLAAGILFLWIAIRYPGRYVQVTPQEITLKGYFRTVTMPWHGIVCLIARDHRVLTLGGLTPTGIMYSVYSPDRKLWFSDSISESARLASIISEATGLKWE